MVETRRPLGIQWLSPRSDKTCAHPYLFDCLSHLFPKGQASLCIHEALDILVFPYTARSSLHHHHPRLYLWMHAGKQLLKRHKRFPGSED